MELDEAALANLRESGLSDKTIEAMKIRMVGIKDEFKDYGYIIPYFEPNAEATKYQPVLYGQAEFSRLRILKKKPEVTKPVIIESSDDDFKYRQLSGSGNHIYLPPIRPAKDWFNTSIPLIFTEGEKKAACGVQHGFLCAAVGGVYSWMSRRITVPTDAVRSYHKGAVSLDLKKAFNVEDLVANELMYIPFQDRPVFICFDEDTKPKTVEYVQKAAFDFAMWLESQGAVVRQIRLSGSAKKKVALDDFLIEYGSRGLLRLMERAVFPTHPRIRQWINSQLTSKNVSRKTQIKVSRAILSTIDTRGVRYKDSLDQFFYFDHGTDILHRVDRREQTDSFHRLLVSEFGLTHSDRDIVTRIRDEFESIPTIKDIDRVYKQAAVIGENFCYQTSNSRYVEVSEDGLKIRRNGEGLLFEAGVHETFMEDPPDFLDPSQSHLEDSTPTSKPLSGHSFGWIPTLQTTSIRPMPGFSRKETTVFLASLFYLSPWLKGWKRLMLPAELAISEAGSGKSSLYQLRKAIYCGSPRLNQEPESIRDWYAALANEPGIWVGDNVGSKIEERISNEIARMITDPEPTFELRQLYTTNNLARVPVNCTFAFTGIQNPFHKNDLIQRAVVLEFEAIDRKDGQWLERHLAERELWVAHQLDVIHMFLSEAEDYDWDEVGSHRLVNFENALKCMGSALGYPETIKAAVGKISGMVSTRVRQSTPVMEGLLYFSRRMSKNGVISNGHDPVYDITAMIEVIQDHPDGLYEDVRVLTSPRLLGRYIGSHANDVYQSTAIRRLEKMRNGRNVYTISRGKLEEIGSDE